MHPTLFVIVHPTFPWDESDFIPSWVREETLSKASHSIAAMAREAARFQGTLILIDPGSGDNLPVDVAQSFQVIRQRANFSIEGEAAASSDSAARAIHELVESCHSVMIGGFWRNRCCQDLRGSLSRLRLRFPSVEVRARFSTPSPH